MNTIRNINIGQRLIAIDQDAFTTLQNYLQSLKEHFAKEQSGDEIYNDIEFRISDIMNAKLKTGTASISQSDITEIIGRIGTLKELGIAEDTDSSAPSGAPNAQHNEETFSNFQTSSKKKLTRSEHEKLLTGLCAGVARYINVDPVWVRLSVVFLTPFGIGIVLYILFSAIIPKTAQAIYVSKRLMRDTAQGAIGGVCSGIAKYINMSASNVRIATVVCTVLFSLPAFMHGAFFIGGPLIGLYILLWIIMPKANTAREQLQMRGIEANAQNIQNQKYGNSPSMQTTKNTGCLAFVYLLLKAIAWFSFAIAIAVIGALFSGLFFGAGSLSLVADYLFREGNQTVFATATWILLFGVPVITIIYIIAKVISGNRNTMGGALKNFALAWAAGWLCLIFLVMLIKADFSTRTNSATTMQANTYKEKVLYIDRSSFTLEQTEKHFSFFDFRYGFLNDTIIAPLLTLTIVPSTSSTFELLSSTSAYGSDSADALKNAYAARYYCNIQDSILYIPYVYSIKHGDLFRAQVAEVKLGVPEGKQIVFSEEALALMIRSNGEINFIGTAIIRRSNKLRNIKSNTIYEMRNGTLVEIGKTKFNKDDANPDIISTKEDLDEALSDAQQGLNEAQQELEEALDHITIEVDSADVQNAQRELNAAKKQLQKFKDGLEQKQNKTFEKVQNAIDKEQAKLSETI